MPYAALGLHRTSGSHRIPQNPDQGRSDRSLASLCALPRSKKRPHVERRLRGAVCRIASGRAGVAGEASPAETSGARAAGGVRNTGIDVVAARGERTGGTGREAWSFGTALARARALVARRKVETFAERESAPVRMPQAVVRVHQRPDGGGIHGAGPLRPTDERQPGRTAEREVRGRVQGACEPGDDPPAPPVEGVRRAVVRLFGGREGGPHPGPGVADEEERHRG